MAPTFTCPSCQHQLRLEERHAGERKRCPACGSEFTVSPSASQRHEPHASKYQDWYEMFKMFIFAPFHVKFLSVITLAQIGSADETADEDAKGYVGDLLIEAYVLEAMLSHRKSFSLTGIATRLLTGGEDAKELKRIGLSLFESSGDGLCRNRDLFYRSFYDFSRIKCDGDPEALDPEGVTGLGDYMVTAYKDHIGDALWRVTKSRDLWESIIRERTKLSSEDKMGIAVQYLRNLSDALAGQ